MREHRHARERLHVLDLVEPQAPCAHGERLRVHLVVVEEELPGEDVGHVIATDHQGERDIPEPVGAPVGEVVRAPEPLDQALVDAQVALQAACQRDVVEPVEPRADILPAGGDEDGAVGVEDGERDVEGRRQALADALHALQIDETGQWLRLGRHAPTFPSSRRPEHRKATLPRHTLVRYPPPETAEPDAGGWQAWGGGARRPQAQACVTRRGRASRSSPAARRGHLPELEQGIHLRLLAGGGLVSPTVSAGQVRGASPAGTAGPGRTSAPCGRTRSDEGVRQLSEALRGPDVHWVG